MFKKYISVLLGTLLLLSSVTTLSADPLSITINPDGTNTFSYKYNTDVYNGDECSVYVKDSVNDTYVYTSQNKVDMYGRLSDTITLANSGSYVFGIFPIDASEAVEYSFSIYTVSALIDLWNDITSFDKTRISDSWDEACKAFSITLDPPLQEDYKLRFYELLASRSDGTVWGDQYKEKLADFNEIANEIALFTNISFLDEKSDTDDAYEMLEKTFNLIKDKNKELYSDINYVISISEEKKFTQYFLEIVSHEVCNLESEMMALDKVTKKLGFEQVKKDICSVNHSSEIKKLISNATNAKFLGIKDLIDDYLNLESTYYVDDIVLKDTSLTPDEFKEVFAKAITDAPKPEDINKPLGPSPSVDNGNKRPSSPASGVLMTDSKPIYNEHSVPFSDMADYEWAQEAVSELYDAKIINGRSDTEFAPSDNVTRAEFCKLISVLFGYDTNITGNAKFEDVNESEWYYPYVMAASNAGVVSGDGTSFMPTSLITRQDAAVILYRAVSPLGNMANPEASFTDEATIAPYARTAVMSLGAKGIINGMADGSFAPIKNLTRAESAKLIYVVAVEYALLNR